MQNIDTDDLFFVEYDNGDSAVVLPTYMLPANTDTLLPERRHRARRPVHTAAFVDSEAPEINQVHIDDTADEIVAAAVLPPNVLEWEDEKNWDRALKSTEDEKKKHFKFCPFCASELPKN